MINYSIVVYVLVYYAGPRAETQDIGKRTILYDTGDESKVI